MLNFSKGSIFLPFKENLDLFMGVQIVNCTNIHSYTKTKRKENHDINKPDNFFA